MLKALSTGEEEDALNLSGDWIFNMTLLSGSSTYGKWPEYAQQGTSPLIPVVHNDDGTLEFESPDQSITLSGSVSGDQVTIDFHQVLVDEETSNVFEGNATFTSTITKKPSDDGTGIIATIEGTYSGSGWLKFYDEQTLLTDFGSWSGEFRTIAYKSIDNDPGLLLQHQLSDQKTLLYAELSNFDHMSLELLVNIVDEVSQVDTRSEKETIIADNKKQMEELYQQTIVDFREVFEESRDLITDFSSNGGQKETWQTFASVYSDQAGIMKDLFSEVIQLISPIANPNSKATICKKAITIFYESCAELKKLPGQVIQFSNQIQITQVLITFKESSINDAVNAMNDLIKVPLSDVTRKLDEANIALADAREALRQCEIINGIGNCPDKENETRDAQVKVDIAVDNYKSILKQIEDYSILIGMYRNELSDFYKEKQKIEDAKLYTQQLIDHHEEIEAQFSVFIFNLCNIVVSCPD
ncbi:MAG: hypothetical protein NUW37_08090 [Planctomycetes bacterium]|nr:hypothetical protein [Planctomycetota bacterium]